MKPRQYISTDNVSMPFLLNYLHQLPPRTLGALSAVITVLIWTAFIVIARASAQGNLLPLDIACLRLPAPPPKAICCLWTSPVCA